jgi:O-antigen/teichoic acid export membrane protein
MTNQPKDLDIMPSLVGQEDEKVSGTPKNLIGDLDIYLSSKKGAGKFIKDLAIYSPSQFLPALTAFITTPILTRLFAPSEYGYWALAGGVSGFLASLAVSGFGSAALRYYPAYKARSTLNVFFATLGVSIGTAIIVVAGVSFLALLLFKEHISPALYPLLPLVIMIFIAESFFAVFISVMRAQERSGLFTSFQLLRHYGSLGFGLLLVVVLGFRVEGLLWGTFLILVLTLPFLIRMATKGVGIHPQHSHLADFLQIWHFAWPLTLGNVAMWGLRVSDLFIISLFWTERDVGLYSVSYNISARSIELLVMLFLLSVSPLVYSTWENEGREATEKTLSMLTRVYLILCLPAAVGLSVLAFPFVALLTSPDYYEGFKIVGFVVFSSFFWGLAFIASMGIAIKKKAIRLGANQIIAASTHIGLQLLLVPRFGYAAAAISTLIGYTVLFVLMTLASRPYLTWRFPFSTLGNVIVASVLMGLAAWGIYRLSGAGNKGSPVYLFLSIVVAVPTYFVCLWRLGEVKGEEKKAVLQLCSRLTKKVVRSEFRRRH